MERTSDIITRTSNNVVSSTNWQQKSDELCHSRSNRRKKPNGNSARKICRLAQESLCKFLSGIVITSRLTKRIGRNADYGRAFSIGRSKCTTNDLLNEKKPIFKVRGVYHVEAHSYMHYITSKIGKLNSAASKRG
ncbi:hypothetical protein Y032_0121g983 [Ancylostoma ceylanicum]|uniref:Uncharacterized protein n=1 Tax=Ancylostoma ceylanicum TaxID=53326 RepID=A0A016TAL1_9BILA|nr:hypothetical protein Y032_0121g983 [Ancylostoma ceylanicum]